MVYIRQKITIVSIKKPSQRNINQELQWLGSSLGLFNMRDKDKSCFRVFIELLKSAKSGHPLSSDEIAEAFPADLMSKVGYFGPAAGAKEAFLKIAEGLDTAIVRVVVTRPGIDATLAAIQACAPNG